MKVYVSFIVAALKFAIKALLYSTQYLQVTDSDT
jgi:hypothetical protein